MRINQTIDHRNFFDRYDNERRDFYQFNLTVDVDNGDHNFNAIHQIFSEASEKVNKLMIEQKPINIPSVPQSEMSVPVNIEEL